MFCHHIVMSLFCYLLIVFLFYARVFILRHGQWRSDIIPHWTREEKIQGKDKEKKIAKIKLFVGRVKAESRLFQPVPVCACHKKVEKSLYNFNHFVICI